MSFGAPLLSIGENLIASAIVAMLLVLIFRRPIFRLHLDFIPEKERPEGTSLPVLDVSATNKKWWVGFGPEEVMFGLLIPSDFVSSKKIFLKNKDGEAEWCRDWRGANKIIIHGKEYYLCRQVINLAVHPDSRTHFLRIVGDFSRDEKLRIYYYFETPFGRYPWLLSLGKRSRTAERGKLPYTEIEIN